MIVASLTHGITGDANLPASANNTKCSSAVTHPSSNLAQRCLTSVFEWELVRSAWHDIVDNPRKYVCPITMCYIQFSQVWLWMLSLSIHMKMHEKIHTFDKPFSCSQCDYKCSTLDNLKRHEKIRAVDKPFSCSQCDYKCSSLGHLKRHEKIHTVDSPFNCSKCDYKCSHNQSIWRCMKKSTLLISHSVAPSVTINTQHWAIWRDMKKSTLLISHSVAPSVTINVQH